MLPLASVRGLATIRPDSRVSHHIWENLTRNPPRIASVTGSGTDSQRDLKRAYRVGSPDTVRNLPGCLCTPETSAFTCSWPAGGDRVVFRRFCTVWRRIDRRRSFRSRIWGDWWRSQADRTLSSKMSQRAQSDDIGWQHGVMVDNKRHHFMCNYCGFIGRGGGVSRLKKHLAGGRMVGYNEIHPCKSVPREVKELMSRHLKEMKIEHQRKKAERATAERKIDDKATLNLEDDEMMIYLKVMKTVAMKVNKSETVSNIKERFQRGEGIPSKLQKIFYAGNPLKDEKTLAECDISDASTLHLFLNAEAGININVKLPPTGKTIMLEVMKWDTIKNIKAKIHALEGILVDHQHILYKGGMLDDSRTLASCNIQQNSTLNLVLSSRAEMQISVCIPYKEKIALDVKSWYTVWDVKCIIESIMQISVYKHKLSYEGILLDDTQSLSDYKIENASTVHLLYSIQIFLRTECGNTMTIEAETADTIDQLKERIHQKRGMPPQYQSLAYAGKKLAGDRCLADYNVEDQSTLHLMLVPGLCDCSLTIYLVPFEESIDLRMMYGITIKDVKVKIQEMKKIPEKRQKLFYGDKLLSNDTMSLFTAGLPPESRLTLELTE